MSCFEHDQSRRAFLKRSAALGIAGAARWNATMPVALTDTGVPTDLAIRGKGFFLVRDPATSVLFATRAGLFLLDRDGYLVTYQHWRVQGFSDTALTTPGDVRIDGTQRPDTAVPEAKNRFILRPAKRTDHRDVE